MAMLFLTCSKVVMPIKLLAPTISHILSSTLYSNILIDGYTPPGTQWYTVVHSGTQTIKKRKIF